MGMLILLYGILLFLIGVIVGVLLICALIISGRLKYEYYDDYNEDGDDDEKFI